MTVQRSVRVDEDAYSDGQVGRWGGRKQKRSDWSRMTRVNVEPDVWLEFRAFAIRQDRSVADLLGEIVTAVVRPGDDL